MLKWFLCLVFVLNYKGLDGWLKWGRWNNESEVIVFEKNFWGS